MSLLRALVASLRVALAGLAALVGIDLESYWFDVPPPSASAPVTDGWPGVTCAWRGVA